MKAVCMAAIAACFLVSAPLAAHHSFAAEFDDKKPLKLRGTVTEWEMINPHSWIHLDVKGDDGKVVSWLIEGGSPNTLMRYGFTRDALPPGSEIVVEGFQSKDGSNRGVGATLTYASDGRRLFLGGSAPGSNPSADH